MTNISLAWAKYIIQKEFFSKKKMSLKKTHWIKTLSKYEKKLVQIFNAAKLRNDKRKTPKTLKQLMTYFYMEFLVEFTIQKSKWHC